MRLADCFTGARPVEPQVADGRILLPFGLGIDVEATMDGARAGGIGVERRELDDPQLRAVWGDHLYRIILTLPGQRGSLSTVVRPSAAARATPPAAPVK